MSLAQHVTQAEGFDYERPTEQVVSNGNNEAIFGTLNPDHLESSNDDPHWRRLSFAPIETVHVEKPIAAYKVSNSKRWVQVGTGIVACWLAAGIVFGFAALKPVLIAEGVYSNLCDAKDPSTVENGDNFPCTEQDLRLNLFFIAASVTANVSSLLAGSVLDRYGRRVCWIASSVCLTLGCILMAVSRNFTNFDGYFLGNMLLALGGTFIFVSSFQLANAFPKYSGHIIALVTGAFDASAAVFLIYRAIYESTEGGFSLERFFYAYIVIPVLIVVAEFAYMPVRSYHTIPQLDQKIEEVQDEAHDVHESDDDIDDAEQLRRVRNARADRRLSKLDQIEEVAGDAEQREERVKVNEERQGASGVWGVLHGVPAHQQIQSPWFILILFLTIVQMLRMNYFIATIHAQYRYMLGSEADANTINRFFDVSLPIGGLVSTPFIGVLLNNLSVPSTFGVLTALIFVIGILNCLPFGWAGYATVVLFVLFRPLYYSAISDYATKVFGFATFGRIYGTIVCISGLVNFAQSGLDALTHGPLHGDPTPVNITLGASGTVIGAILTAFVAIRGRAFVTEEKPELDASEERQRLLPSAGQDYGSRE
ncbi:major facilitator superfamily transporter [Colletotrichum orchidophilum]|uniref:Major facilitator superfamily transporter n=1 Tax=Colletotrichum orchidophilum TaxID=1209926 RepID=A0A1G4BF65_9PEZI|nr:major facilitator superfamily transporter [Colletotrichum orchidophilum]OHE99995.1 major facilitator superfamily transporter [Colletotrichum orchidophilum]